MRDILPIVIRTRCSAVFHKLPGKPVPQGSAGSQPDATRLAGANPGKRGEWDSIQQAAFHLRTVACMAAHHSALATT